MRSISHYNQKIDTTAQLYCTLSMYITPKTISHQNQKTNTTPQLYYTLSTKVCKTKIYFLPEPKTDTKPQLEKKFLQPTCSKCLLFSWRSRVTRGAYWESTNVEYPGLTMGKVRQISADLDGFRCMNNDSYIGIDRFKNSSNAIPIGGCIQSCRDYRQSEVAMGKARQKQLKTGDCRIGNSHSRIEHARLLDWHQMNF